MVYVGALDNVATAPDMAILSDNGNNDVITVFIGK